MWARMYRLDADGNPVAEPNTITWGRWFETADRIVAQDTVYIVAQDTVLGVKVSTVFLGLNHNYGPGPPLLWETMTFAVDSSRPELDGLQERYETKEAALAGHKAMLARVTEAS